VSGGFSFAGAVSGPHFDGVADQIISGSGKLSEPRVADGEAVFHHGFSGMRDVFQVVLIEHAKAGIACGVIAGMWLQIFAEQFDEFGDGLWGIGHLQVIEEGRSQRDDGFTGPAGFDGDSGAEGDNQIAPFHDAVGIDGFVCVMNADVGQLGRFFEWCEQVTGHVCLVRVKPDDEEHVGVFAAGFFDDWAVVEEGGDPVFSE